MRGGRQWGPPLSTATIVDSDLLSHFHKLPRSKQSEVATSAGFTREIVSRQLRNLAQALVVF